MRQKAHELARRRARKHQKQLQLQANTQGGPLWQEELLKDIKQRTSCEEVQKDLQRGATAEPDVQKEIIRIALKDWLYKDIPGFEPRPKQLEALHTLIYKRTDLILIAKTSFGKSVPIQAVSALVPETITIMILPLNKVGEEQAAKIAKLPGTQPCLVTADTVKTDQNIFADIQRRKYTHILISPEQALGEHFTQISRDPSFTSKVTMVAVDEVHLVKQWGLSEFRKDYSRLAELRSRLGESVVWFACSATIDADTKEKVIAHVKFHPMVEILRTSIDRPDIKLIIDKIKPKTIQSCDILYITLKDAVDSDKNPTPFEIPKTIIFIDSKKRIRKAVNQLQKWILKMSPKYTAKQLRRMVVGYHRSTSKHDQEKIYNELNKKGKESEIRIVVATESLGLGVDLSDIFRVVQYGFPIGKDLAILWQRFGRAARDAKLNGEAIFLVEPWAFGTRDYDLASDSSGGEDDVVDEDIAPSTIQKKMKNDIERRNALTDVIYNLLNSELCIRGFFLEYFEEHLAIPETRLPAPDKASCCNRCNLSMWEFIPAPVPDTEIIRKPPSNSPQGTVLDMLQKWGMDRVKEAEPDLDYDADSSLFLDSERMIMLARASNEPNKTIEWLISIVGSQWRWLDAYGASLLDALNSIVPTAIAQHQAATAVRAQKKKQTHAQRIKEAPFPPSPVQRQIDMLFEESAKSRAHARRASDIVLNDYR